MKTPRNRSPSRYRTRRTRGGNLPKYASTYESIYKWYTKIFEKLGWIVLAKAKKNGDKIKYYKYSISYFLKCIDHVMNEYENHNRKHDLRVIKMNIEELQAFVNKNF